METAQEKTMNDWTKLCIRQECELAVAAHLKHFVESGVIGAIIIVMRIVLR